MGGGLYTWFLNYKSPKHSIPLLITLFLIIILSDNINNIKNINNLKNINNVDNNSVVTESNINTGIRYNIKNNSRNIKNNSTNQDRNDLILIVSSFFPLIIGFLGGPILIYCNNIIEEMKKK